MINFAKILSWSFWLAIHPPAMTLSFSIFLVVIFSGLILAGLICRSFYRKLKKTDRFVSYFWRKLATMFFSMGIFGLVLVFFSYEGIPLFGMRLWYLVWALLVVFWTARIFYYRYKELPQILSKNHEAAIKTV